MNSFTDGYEDTIRMKKVDNRYIQFPDGAVWRISCNQYGKMLFNVEEEEVEEGYNVVRFEVAYQEDNKPLEFPHDLV